MPAFSWGSSSENARGGSSSSHLSSLHVRQPKVVPLAPPPLQEPFELDSVLPKKQEGVAPISPPPTASSPYSATPSSSAALLPLSIAGTIFFSVSHSLFVKHIYSLNYTLDPNQMAMWSESTKLCLAVSALYYITRTDLPTHPVFPPRDRIRWGFVINAWLYLFSNVVDFVILSRIPLTIYLVVCQQKIVWTALLTTVVLKRPLSRVQWLACVLLMLGICISLVSFEDLSSTLSSTSVSAGSSGDYPNGLSLPLFLLTLQAIASGLSNVWSEKMMQRPAVDTASLPLASSSDAAQANTNTAVVSVVLPLYNFFFDSMQLYAIGVPFYILSYLFAPYSAPPDSSPCPPYLSLLLSLNGAVAGLFIGSVFKFASALTRVFVQGVAFVLGIGAAAVVLGEEPKSLVSFALGATFVLGSNVVFKNADSCNFGDIREGFETARHCCWNRRVVGGVAGIVALAAALKMLGIMIFGASDIPDPGAM